jgi:hypothetical protein
MRTVRNMSRRGWQIAAAVAVAAALTAVTAVVALLPLQTQLSEEAPGVEVLNRWVDEGARGDLADDAGVTDAAEAAAVDALGRKFTRNGPAHTVFAVSAASGGAVAFVVQYATYRDAGQSLIAPGVSLPVGVGVWLDAVNDVTFTQVAAPVSQSESSEGPGSGALTVGMWSSPEGRELVVFDTGYGTKVSQGVFGPQLATPRNLVSAGASQAAPFVDGYAVVDVPADVLSATATVELQQPRELSNWPLLLGSPYALSLQRGSELSHVDLALYSEGGSAQSPVRIKPYPAAFGGYEAQRLSRQWTMERVTVEPTWKRSATGSGIVLQAQLPSGHKLVMQWVIEGKAYVAFVQTPGGRVHGVRCTTPGSVLTVMCELPSDLGRLFVTNEQFMWRTASDDWSRAKGAYYDETFAAVVPDKVTIRVTPQRSEAFTLRFS